MGCRDKGQPDRADRDLPQRDPPVVTPEPEEEDPEPDPEPEPEPEPEPVEELYVSIDNTYGDRFKPVVVYIDYTIDGVGAEFEYSVPYGEVKEFPNYLEIYGDGQRHEDLTLTVNGEEFLYQLYPEPRCGKVDLDTDCEGYEYLGPPDGYIWYGEDDDTIVEWQVGYIMWDDRAEPYEFIPSNGEDNVWYQASKLIDLANGVYERSGVRIRLVLEPSAVGIGRYMNNEGHTQMARSIGTADVSIGVGLTCIDTGGCARVNTYFRPNTGFTLGGTIGRNQHLIALHEIGHMVGLAHGPDNSAYAAEGYIWPDFGHGYSQPFCPNQEADLMSYAYRASVHNNSQINCSDGWPAGDRTYADSAYHLNRVRYDVSMIGVAPDAPPAYMEEVPEMGPLVLD